MMVTPRNDMVEMATARANLYALLADVFREEPSEAFLAGLANPGFTGALKTLNLALDDVFSETSRARLVEDLAIEYTRLFIGPGSHISPNESMHTNARFGEPNSFWGKQTVEVKKFMAAAGLEVDAGFGGMPDHITAEFEFMQQLLLKEAEAWDLGEHESGLNTLRIEKQFYDEHISQWVCNFCEKVLKAAGHPYFRQFAEITSAFIELEKETLKELIEQAEDADRLSA